MLDCFKTMVKVLWLSSDGTLTLLPLMTRLMSYHTYKPLNHPRRWQLTCITAHNLLYSVLGCFQHSVAGQRPPSSHPWAEVIMLNRLEHSGLSWGSGSEISLLRIPIGSWISSCIASNAISHTVPWLLLWEWCIFFKADGAFDQL